MAARGGGCRGPVRPLVGCLSITSTVEPRGVHVASHTFRGLPISRCGMGKQVAGIEGSRGPSGQGRVHAVLGPQQLHLNA